MKLKRGYIHVHVYTGNGKGKTTSAIGLAVRASGAGFKTYIGQFMKEGPYSEVKALNRIRNIEIEQFGRSCFISKKPTSKDLKYAKMGIRKVLNILSDKKHDIVILDEINTAVHYKLVNLSELISLCEAKPKAKELILTGRYANAKILKLADLVSDIKEIKHYYRKGIKARKGIEF